MATRHSEIRRHGRRITKMTSGQRGRPCYEYFGYPVVGIGVHKLGQITRIGSGTFHALRGMRSGPPQIRDDFATMREAEDWIALCDIWGLLDGDPGAVLTAENSATAAPPPPPQRLTDDGDTHG